jgi:hypothetical protein
VVRTRGAAAAVQLCAVSGMLALLAVSGYGVNPRRMPRSWRAAKSARKTSSSWDRTRCGRIISPATAITADLAEHRPHRGAGGEFPALPDADRLDAGVAHEPVFLAVSAHARSAAHVPESRDGGQRANREAPSLGAELQRLGYDTAVIGDWCACGFTELPMGFKDVIVSDFDNFRVYMSEVVFLHHQILPLFFDNRVGHMLVSEAQVVRELHDAGSRDRPGDRPAQAAGGGRKPFLLLGYYSCTHLPYKTPTHYAKLWTDPKYDGPHKHELALNVDEFIGNTDINEKWSKLPPRGGGADHRAL